MYNNVKDKNDIKLSVLHIKLVTLTIEVYSNIINIQFYSFLRIKLF